MHVSSVPLLLLAAGVVGFLHSILPDHWVPLAVVARTNRWSIARTARISLLASVGHVLTSIILAAIIALVGSQFRRSFESQQGHIVGVVLIATGIGFFIWSLTGGEHHHDEHAFIPGEGAVDEEGRIVNIDGPSTGGRIAAIIVPFGAAASPDLTVLPVTLAASGIGLAAVGGVLVTFPDVTLATFVVLTVGATLAGYQVTGEWLEDHGMLITAAVFAGL